MTDYLEIFGDTFCSMNAAHSKRHSTSVDVERVSCKKCGHVVILTEST